MMDFGNLAQLGVGGAILIASLHFVDKIIGRWAAARGHVPASEGSETASGAKPVSFWQVEVRKAIEEGLVDRVLPVLSRQTELLEKQNDLMVRFATLLEVASARDEERNRT